MTKPGSHPAARVAPAPAWRLWEAFGGTALELFATIHRAVCSASAREYPASYSRIAARSW